MEGCIAVKIMKKWILICVCVLLICGSVCSCTPIEDLPDDTEPNEEVTAPPPYGDKEKLTEAYARYLREEPSKEELPSYDDLMQIKRGMSVEQVFAIAGHPQLCGLLPGASSPVLYTEMSSAPHYNLTGYCYDTAEGKPVCITYIYDYIWTDHLLVYRIEDACEFDENIITAEDFYNYNPETLPTDAECQSIADDTSFQDLIAAIGRPHNGYCGPNLSCTVEWKTAEGNFYHVALSATPGPSTGQSIYTALEVNGKIRTKLIRTDASIIPE